MNLQVFLSTHKAMDSPQRPMGNIGASIITYTNIWGFLITIIITYTILGVPYYYNNYLFYFGGSLLL